MKTERLTFGLIGAGGIAQSQHLPNFARMRHAALRTVCDLRGDVAEAMRRKYGVPLAAADSAAVMEDPLIDAVLIATKPDTHVELTIRALEHGKHVYVEKPLAETPELCRAVAEARERAGRRVAVGFNRRFAPAYREARRLLAAHGGARNVFYRLADAYGLEGGWGSAFPPGYRLVTEVCHIFDLLRWMVGADVRTVYDTASRADDETITLRFENGAVAAIMSSGYATGDFPKESLEVVAAEGCLTVENFVELRTYGWADAPACSRFPGHWHPDRENSHAALYATLGAEAMRAVRAKTFWLERAVRGRPVPSGTLEAAPDARDYVERRAPLLNYDTDKGWVLSVDRFAQDILEDRPQENAGALDGLAAARICAAAAASRETGAPVAP